MVSITQLVECQIVALEVSGSNPGIYPTFMKTATNNVWLIKLFPKFSKNLNLMYMLLLFKKFNVSLVILDKKYELCVLHFKHIFKSLFQNCTVQGNTQQKFMKFKFSPKFISSSDKFFQTLIKNLVSTVNKSLSTHPSFVPYYYNISSNLGLLNLSKVLLLWNNIFTLLINIFYSKLDYIVFSNPYFRYESLALNYKALNFLSKLWKLSSIFIFFIGNKSTLSNESYFRYLLGSGYRFAFVIDLYYHKVSIQYLNRFKFITIGPTPLSSNLYSLSVSLPVLSNSVLSNLFFIRLLFQITKLTRRIRYDMQLNLL